MPSDHPRTPESPTSIESSKQNPSPRPTQSLPTPAHSINGSMSSIGSDMVHDDSSNKRKREIEDQGDREQKKAHVDNAEEGRLRIGDLHVNVGKKYFLCKTPITPSVPDATQDMFARYGLQDIAKSVARTLPDGSKGVKLRKTYKNHIKDHNLMGAFDSVKRELDNPKTLWAMMSVPQEQWDMDHVRGKEIEERLPPSMVEVMGLAFNMSKGVIPKQKWNWSVLGDLAAPPSSGAVSAQNGGKIQQTHPGMVRTKSGTKVGDTQRPKRSLKKRGYGDSSYEGYGEGFVDDDTPGDGGYDTGDADDKAGPSRKKAKKFAQNPPGGPRRQDSYGPGMVGA